MIAVLAINLLLPEYEGRDAVRVAYFLTTGAHLDELRGDLYELQVGLLVQEVLLHVEHELIQAPIGYSKHIVRIDHEDGPCTLT